MKKKKVPKHVHNKKEKKKECANVAGAYGMHIRDDPLLKPASQRSTEPSTA